MFRHVIVYNENSENLRAWTSYPIPTLPIFFWQFNFRKKWDIELKVWENKRHYKVRLYCHKFIEFKKYLKKVYFENFFFFIPKVSTIQTYVSVFYLSYQILTEFRSWINNKFMNLFNNGVLKYK